MSAIIGPVSAGQRYKRGSPCPVCGGYDGLKRGRGVRCSGYSSSDSKVAFCTREEYAGDLAPIAGGAVPTWAHFLAGRCKCGRDHAHQAPEARAPRGDHQAERRGFAGPPKRGEIPYTYVDVGGSPLFQVRRVPTPEGGKTFYQVHYEQARGGWIHGRGAAPLVLYRLPEIADASQDTPIWLVEGEKCADALARLGLVATCNAGGALKNADAWQASYSEALRDRPVIILQDNDTPGRRHAEIARNALYGIARSVQVLPPFGAAPGYDVVDWLAEGNGKEQLLALAEKTPTWAPETGEALLLLFMRQHSGAIKAEALEGALARIRASLAEIAQAEREALLCDLARLMLDYVTRAIDTLRAAPVPIHASAGRDLMKGKRGAHVRAMCRAYLKVARRQGASQQTAELEIAWREALQSLDGAIIRAPRQAPEGAEIAGEPGAAPDAPPLVSVGMGDIYLTAEGFYLQGVKRGRLLLGAPVRVLRVASGDNASLFYLEITPPKTGEAITLTANDKEIEKGTCWRNLDGRVSPLPSTQSEYDAMYAALRALAARADNVKVQVLASALGWQSYSGRWLWVAANGVQDGHARLIGEEAPLFANTREITHPPFTLPEGDLLPSVAPLRELLAFWRKEQTLFAYAALGAHAQVSKPLAGEYAGTLDFAFEGIAETGEGKSTCLNWTHRLFQGTGYTHATHTLLNDNGLTKDTGIASARLRAMMKYHAYQTADRNAKPGNADYARQQDNRIKWLMSIGNRDAAGVRSQRDSKAIESRGEPAGLVCMAGEADPYDYTVTVGALDADARAMTFHIPTGTPEEGAERITRSERIDEQRAGLDALAVAWRAYLLAERAELDARDAHYKAEAARAFVLAVAETGGRVHARASGKVQQVVSGMREYARFLARSGIAGAAEIAADIEATIPLLIAERAEAEAHLWDRHHEKGATPEEGEADQALGALYALLERGHITDKKGGMPTLPARLLGTAGWIHISSEVDALRPRGNPLCWTENGIAYFYAPIRDLCGMIQRQTKLTLSPQRLREILEKAGVAMMGNQKDGHKGIRRRAPDGSNTQRLAIRLDALLGEYDQGEAETPEGAEIAEQAPEVAHQGNQGEPERAPGGERPAESAAPVAPLWCVGKPWYHASRVDEPASQALEWACPSIPVAAKWYKPIVKEAFATGAYLAGVLVDGRRVSPDMFLATLRHAYASNDRGMLAHLARSVGANPAEIMPEQNGGQNYVQPA